MVSALLTAGVRTHSATRGEDRVVCGDALIRWSIRADGVEPIFVLDRAIQVGVWRGGGSKPPQN